MEDILASIRRIIADDQSQGGRQGNASRRPQASASPTPEAEGASNRTRTPYDDVLDLARLVPSPVAMEQEPAAEAVETEAVLSSIEHRADDQEGDMPQHTLQVEEAPQHDYDAEPSVSALRARMPEPYARHQDTEDQHATQGALTYDHHDDARDELLSAPLGASVMSAFETLAATVVLQNTPMLERVMRDLLRPMLKTWLDDNLPALVERLVRTEIERVARGSRG